MTAILQTLWNTFAWKKGLVFLCNFLRSLFLPKRPIHDKGTFFVHLWQQQIQLSYIKATVEIRANMNNCIPLSCADVITYPCRKLNADLDHLCLEHIDGNIKNIYGTSVYYNIFLQLYTLHKVIWCKCIVRILWTCHHHCITLTLDNRSITPEICTWVLRSLLLWLYCKFLLVTRDLFRQNCFTGILVFVRWHSPKPQQNMTIHNNTTMQ